MNEHDVDALQLSDAICALRLSKLPAIEEIGNAGSFFKNPVVTKEVQASLRAVHRAMPFYENADGGFKLSAAWLIEQCGWKGHRQGNAGISEKHALVLVNHGGASGSELWQLAQRVALSVFSRFAVSLEAEPRVI